MSKGTQLLQLWRFQPERRTRASTACIIYVTRCINSQARGNAEPTPAQVEINAGVTQVSRCTSGALVLGERGLSNLKQGDTGIHAAFSSSSSSASSLSSSSSAFQGASSVNIFTQKRASTLRRVRNKGRRYREATHRDHTVKSAVSFPFTVILSSCALHLILHTACVRRVCAYWEKK